MSIKRTIYPETYLSIIAIMVFFPIMFVFNKDNHFNIWKFSLIFTTIIIIIFLYAWNDIRKRQK